MDLIVFDLGFTEKQKIKLRQNCNCRLERFPFENYPQHVSILHGYAWKPLVIQTVRKKYPFVMWMDASVRFTTNNITWLFNHVRNVGVMALGGSVPIASRTSRQTFTFLNEEPCLFKDKNEFEATYIVIFPSPLVEEYFIKPWVSCALLEGCMVPSSWSHLLHCDNGNLYHNCHRFDQSILSILLYRLYHQTVSQHYMPHTFFQICKGGEEQWFLPNFMNKLLIKFHSIFPSVETQFNRGLNSGHVVNTFPQRFLEKINVYDMGMPSVRYGYAKYKIIDNDIPSARYGYAKSKIWICQE
ncbi:hypothetical protein ACJMK2_024623 [Sinanodonta woodiana]|uniref:Uncharacterized protein n=1 Tax=Sinanodonta woodiana TaxID=1069815 RepID=A0ABD3XFX4_SINWO